MKRAGLMLFTLVLAFAMLAAVLGGCQRLVPVETVPLGTTNLDSLELDSNLTVDGNATVGGTFAVTGNTDLAGTVAFGSDNLYPLGVASSGYIGYFGSAAAVTTTAITSATHGMTTVTGAMCSLGGGPSAVAGAAFACEPTVSGTTVTFALYQDDATAATITDTLYYVIIGQ